MLSNAVDVQWAAESEIRTVGSGLAPGWLKIRSGLVRIEFLGGAQVTLEGPAELRLISASEAFCARGRLTAEVPPPARGFLVTTPQVTIEDLGTEFGVDVRPQAAEVHVFKGEVKLSRESAVRQSLKEGKAVVVEGGTPRPIGVDASHFTSPAELDRRWAKALQRRLANWEDVGRRVNADPSLIAHYDFQRGGDERVLRNRAAIVGPGDAHRPRAGDGTIVGCKWCEGRWPGKGALEFRSLSDRVRIDVPGDRKSLTLAAWVCVYGLDRRLNSLMMSDGFSEGSVHWQILHEGNVHTGLFVRQLDLPDHNYDLDSPVVFTPDWLGRWIQLAVVIDGDKHLIRHFVNGKEVLCEPLRYDVSLRIGEAQLGNWDPGGHKATVWPIRCFSGRMDEFWAFARPLASSELWELYSTGDPYADQQITPLEPKHGHEKP